MIEQLESRRLFAVAADYGGIETFWIGVDNAQDNGVTFNVAIAPDPNGGFIITVNGQSFVDEMPENAGLGENVNWISLSGTDGGDTLNLDIDSAVNAAGLVLIMDTGPGADTINIKGGNARVEINGSTHTDTYNLEGKN